MAAICFLSLQLSLAFFFSSHHLMHAVDGAAILPKQYDNATDRGSLLAFKSAISDDPHGALAQWNDTLRFCLWPGVTCSGGPHRVVALQLGSLDLVGTIPPALANLTSLTTLNLSSNNFHGPIPPELARLSRLQDLDLGRNSLDGTIPSELGQCALLRTMTLSYNTLGGTIPSELGSLPSLYYLDVHNNSVTGHIPPSLSNISSLIYLDLSNNQLSGVIPSALARLSRLEHLDLGYNHLQGDIAPTCNLTSLTYLNLDTNRLSGSLPPNLGQALPNLTFLSVPSNELHGEIPMSLPNATSLYCIQLEENNLIGVIPRNLGSLPDLLWLHLGVNKLRAEEPDDWSFLADLSNCTVLEELGLADNRLGGTLPRSVANLSTTLNFINIKANYIRGRIPPEIGNLVNLTYLGMGPNFLVGSVPASLGLLRNLNALDLSTNYMSGVIPPALGNLSQLILIFLDDNSFTGRIPASLGNCKFLELLDFSRNKLTGTIPKEVLSITTLSIGLSLGENMLSGSIPPEVGSLTNLGKLLLSGNRLSGEIPSSLGKCQVLEFLSLDRNFFQGRIPTSLSALRGLQELNLSQNNLSGELPNFLKDLPRLHYLGLSLNNFEGEVPTTGVFANSTAVVVLGDDKLCGGNPKLHLPACSLKAPKKKKHNSRTLAVIISTSVVSVFLLLLLMLVATRYLLKKRMRESPADHTTMAQIMRVSYAELVRATDGFSEANIIGSGSFGTVYKGVLDNEHGKKVVAVKVFNLHQLGALKSFSAECEAFRNIRHRNLIKILSACSSVDFNGNNFKAMVFEFKPNGSLERWLHSEANDGFGPLNLNLVQRLDLAIDVASALEYLHHHGQTPIIHCDLKPSNILLDDDMTGIVCDFGLARFMKESAQCSNVSLGMKGTIGYIAPGCDKPGGVCQDPRFVGGDGITFYFHGKKDHDFCLLSDSDLHINAHFIGKHDPSRTRDFTWVQSVVILFGSHHLYIGAKKTATWDDTIDRLKLSYDGESIELPANEGRIWRSSSMPSLCISRPSGTNSITVEVEKKFRIEASVVPITEQESRVHNYGMTDDDCLAHLELGFKFYSLTKDVHGVLGQTYREGYVSRVKMSSNMPIMGGFNQYRTSDLYTPDCSVSRFGRKVSGIAMVSQPADVICASGMKGRGIVCKK